MQDVQSKWYKARGCRYYLVVLSPNMLYSTVHVLFHYPYIIPICDIVVPSSFPLSLCNPNMLYSSFHFLLGHLEMKGWGSRFQSFGFACSRYGILGRPFLGFRV